MYQQHRFATQVVWCDLSSVRRCDTMILAILNNFFKTIQLVNGRTNPFTEHLHLSLITVRRRVLKSTM